MEKQDFNKWFIERYLVFLILYIFNMLFPFIQDDLCALEVKNQLSFLEAVNWWYNGLNSRIQNLLTYPMITQYNMWHNLVSAVVGVIFFDLVSKISKVSFIKTIIILSITILPAMWVDFYLYASSFYNHFLGCLIGLITYYAYENNWSSWKLVLLTLILSQTGYIVSIPFLILVAFNFRKIEVIIGLIGLIIFYNLPANHIRAYGTPYLGQQGRFPDYNPITMIKKIIVSWEYFVIPFIIASINYKNLIQLKPFKLLISNKDLGWAIASLSCLGLISIAPISYIGMERTTAVIILLGTIPLIKYIQFNKYYKIFSIITVFGLFVNLFAIDSKNPMILEKYFINFKFKYNDKQSFDKVIKKGIYYKNNPHLLNKNND